MQGKIDKQNVEQIYNLNTVQKGILFDFLNKNDTSYNAQLVLKINGIVNVDRLIKSIEITKNENEALRSIFKWEKLNAPVQIVLKNHFVETRFFDFSNEDISQIETFIEKDKNEMFSLETSPVRFHIIKTDDCDFLLVITHHHILYDGWSTGILLEEIFETYYELEQGLNRKNALKIKYKDLPTTFFQEQILNKKNKTYWREYLENSQPTQLPLIFEAPSNNNEIKKFVLQKEIDSIEKTARFYKVSKPTLLYTAFGNFNEAFCLQLRHTFWDSPYLAEIPKLLEWKR